MSSSTNDLAWAFDIGSTYTKVAVLDLGREKLVATSAAPTTVESDVSRGILQAVEQVEDATGARLQDAGVAVASSSAAGGLRMVVVGLVPSLTVEAAQRAALGAGAKVVGTYAFKLTRAECEKIVSDRPDIILLSGGTDGGHRETIVENARRLADTGVDAPVIVAGNKEASDEVRSVLEAGGLTDIHVTENLLPSVERLNVAPVREVVREVFIRRIVHAKGIDRVPELLTGGVVMPTPVASMRGSELLADGTDEEAGLGELVSFEIGGATTNVHSIATGRPSRGNVVLQGLPQPRVMRTVEGDLGMRWSAPGTLEAVGADRLGEQTGQSTDDLDRRVRELHDAPATVPSDDAAWALDAALAGGAIRLGLQRHAGRLEERYTPTGPIFIQEGKDLSGVETIVGTGGVLIHARRRDHIARTVLEEADPLTLVPRGARFLVDARYLLYAAGLLAEHAPTPALRILKHHLEPVDVEEVSG